MFPLNMTTKYGILYPTRATLRPDCGECVALACFHEQRKAYTPMNSMIYHFVWSLPAAFLRSLLPAPAHPPGCDTATSVLFRRAGTFNAICRAPNGFFGLGRVYAGPPGAFERSTVLVFCRPLARALPFSPSGTAGGAARCAKQAHGSSSPPQATRLISSFHTPGRAPTCEAFPSSCLRAAPQLGHARSSLAPRCATLRRSWPPGFGG